MNLNEQKRAPIYEALNRFRKQRVVPFDVPGHKRGRGNPELVELLGEKCVGIDVNSMKPLDNLCHPVSVIKDAEELAADAFGAAHAFFMVGGTTSSVQSMILSACKKGDKIILPRNVHKSAINALVLCGAVPVYVDPRVEPKLGIPLGMELADVRRAMDAHPDAVAMLLNNPTYYGVCSNLKAIVELAHARGMLAERRQCAGGDGQGDRAVPKQRPMTGRQRPLCFKNTQGARVLALTLKKPFEGGGRGFAETVGGCGCLRSSGSL